jgi:hypothetical protein
MGTRLFTLCGTTADETDDEPCQECLVREFNWMLKPGRDDMLRFVEHSHDNGRHCSADPCPSYRMLLRRLRTMQRISL